MGRFWCCQDAAHKAKAQPSVREGVQHRDTLGMQRFKCQSELLITCNNTEDAQIVRIVLAHSQHHTLYFDVSIPPKAVDIIRDNIDWALPNDVVWKVQLYSIIGEHDNEGYPLSYVLSPLNGDGDRIWETNQCPLVMDLQSERSVQRDKVPRSLRPWLLLSLL